jgi:hypothetical protein
MKIGKVYKIMFAASYNHLTNAKITSGQTENF